MRKMKLAMVALTGLALTLTACGGDPDPDAGQTPNGGETNSTPDSSNGTEETPSESGGALPSTEASVEMMDLLPQAYIDAGSVHIATTDGNAPWAFLDPDTQEASGINADLLTEAMNRLGLEIEWSDVQFTAALPGIQSGRFDIYASAMADRLDRQEAVNFIDYSYEGSGVVVPTGNPLGVETFQDLCGLRINYLTGSLFPGLIEELNAGDCADDPIEATESADKGAIYLAVASGQADVTFDTYGVSNYAFNTAEAGVNLDLELAPIPPFAPARQGMAFNHDEPEFIQAVAGALQQMHEDGTYQEIFAKWSVEDLTVETFTINTVLESALTDFLE